LNRVAGDPAYEGLKNQLIASTGLAFYSDRDEILMDLIEGRLSRLALRSCSSYARFLANGEAGAAEMELLVAQLTIGETYFFRDEDQFTAIRDVILPDILERKQASKELRIWSAGCATGAEPYSLAIVLADKLAGQVDDWQVCIYASDLNQSYLTQAAEGKFRAWALRSTSADMKRDCFSNKGLSWTIDPRYKEWISFHHLNLVGEEFSTPRADARFDLILCRNVMIYFAPEAVRLLIGRFHECLEQGGWLVVGAPEYNVENYKAFRTVTTNGARVYQKLMCAPTRIEIQPEPAKPATKEAPKPEVQPSPEPSPEPAGVNLSGLRQLADQGDWQDAAEYGQKLLREDRLNPAIHFYQALIFENLGVLDQSERSLRQAIYLDRNFALAHYHLGLALKRDRQMASAARCFGNVLRVLSSMPDNAVLAGGPGVTVTALQELARMHLKNSSTQDATI
jgi:chemotaxis protein methyltransferase CheR